MCCVVRIFLQVIINAYGARSEKRRTIHCAILALCLSSAQGHRWCRRRVRAGMVRTIQLARQRKILGDRACMCYEWQRALQKKATRTVIDGVASLSPLFSSSRPFLSFCIFQGCDIYFWPLLQLLLRACQDRKAVMREAALAGVFTACAR